ncbi:hypothetical protein NDU88_002563 [Pleurodeles waltl]|uniref:Uncharacterized protein n=1 Tax=Pleurodeles waltl TaxID=8319 RepID=A0AAV7UAX4_PLEWA|nr:hypothetical protein NDU88_002563 [Pleurodeles waltl]
MRRRPVGPKSRDQWCSWGPAGGACRGTVCGPDKAGGPPFHDSERRVLGAVRQPRPNERLAAQTQAQRGVMAAMLGHTT